MDKQSVFVVKELINQAAGTLVDPDTACLDAELLLTHVTGNDRCWIHAHSDSLLSTENAREFELLIRKRRSGLPIAYLTGQREFWSLSLQVTKETLIPRPETEHLVEQALALIPDNTSLEIADLGTGAGAVALAIASERPVCRIVASDISSAAVQVAMYNARSLQLANLMFVNSDWLKAFKSKFDVIVSNPPYVREKDPHLEKGDVRHEPRLALAAGDDGLACLRDIIRQATCHLRTNGWLLLEHGHDQGAAVRALLAESGYASINTYNDLAGQERISNGQWCYD
ncbi:MAG TPA: peptide chain release factor N(5)-glutamine methyltransferase [Gammaproteobacteria bacterium]|nr:peptide chain release factor N(5)-glutamine methyltransferase [Gammaproteobacteria bacterium]